MGPDSSSIHNIQLIGPYKCTEVIKFVHLDPSYYDTVVRINSSSVLSVTESIVEYLKTSINSRLF